MMQFIPDKLRSGVVVGGSFTGWPGSMIYKDKEIPPVEGLMHIEDDMIILGGIVKEDLNDTTKHIYFENSAADLLVIEG